MNHYLLDGFKSCYWEFFVIDILVINALFWSTFDGRIDRERLLASACVGCRPRASEAERCAGKHAAWGHGANRATHCFTVGSFSFVSRFVAICWGPMLGLVRKG